MKSPTHRFKKTARSSLRTGILLAVGMTVGCSMVGPDYEQPKSEINPEWLDSANPALKRGDAELGTWWKVFKDPILDSLIDQARHQNLSLQAVAVRVLEARAQLGIATGFEYPQVQQGVGGVGVQSLSAHTANTTSAIDRHYASSSFGLNAGWELDVWGKFRRGVEASEANVDASIATYDDALVTLTAEVARVYVLIRTLETEIQVAQDNKKIQIQTLKIADALFSGGLITELDYLQAKTLLSNTEATIPPLQADLRRSKTSLAVLLGKTPGSIDSQISEAKPIPTAPMQVAVGVPADLLRRRPDIRLAENRLMTQSGLIGVAKADLYPHFSLIGSINFSASDAALTAATMGASNLGDIFNARSFQYSIGPSVSWDIFNYGRITNQVRVEDARFQALAANYKQSVLNAAEEAENAAIAFTKSREQSDKLRESVEASKRSTELSLYQYSEGLVDYQRVLDSQRSLLIAQDECTRISGNVANNLIQLYKSLGGGWQNRPEADFVPPAIKQDMEKRTDWGNMLKPRPEEKPAEENNGFWRWPEW